MWLEGVENPGVAVTTRLGAWGRRLGGKAKRLWHRYLRLRELRGTRRELAGLDDHLLKDIGISRSQIEPATRYPSDDDQRFWMS